MASQFTELFLSLPDCLKGVIFNKLEDIKRLYQFYSASDELASVVTDTRSLCLVVSYDMALASGAKAVWPEGLMDFLEKFVSRESITVIFSPAPPMDNMNYIIKWRGDANGYIFFKARRFDAIEEEEVDIYRRPALPDLPTRVKYMLDLVKRFPSLHKISNLDLANQSALILEDQDIQNLNKRRTLYSKVIRKVWHKATMEYCGTMLKDILLHIETEENGSEEELIKKAFPEEEVAEFVAMIMQEKPTTECRPDMVKYYSSPNF